MRKQRFPQRQGLALVIVLALLVLVFALAIGFLTRVSTERTSSDRFASGVSTRLLADSTVQIVQGQINAATTQGSSVAWASQPGLVRTFDDAGLPLKSYKLYSSDAMQVAGALNPATEAETLQAWAASPALFTDINQPVDVNFDGAPDSWPILSPAAVGQVEGFAINSAPSGSSQGVTNAAPMPVRWLYVLKDGQVLSPTGSAKSATVKEATALNPVVGRIAFWTDDESCKVNVNTASEGTYWDVPKVASIPEKQFGTYQPAKNEFQAYPGHPATTSLSAVFPDLTRDQLFALAPRLKNEGSKNLTLNVDQAEAVTLDQDRLYASAGDVIFSPERALNAGLDQAKLERARFFLSTISRAPETNLYNLPRIACWPLHAGTDASFRTSFDSLIAFCSTVNGQPFYFQRQNPDSMTEDYTGIPRNQALFSYLRDLTSRPVPGFGGNLQTKFGEDRDQVLTEIFDYIRCTNLIDGTLSAAKRYAPGTLVNGSKGGSFGYGQVLPIRIQQGGVDTRGFGRVPIFTEVGLWVVCDADPKTVSATDSNNPAVNKALYPADVSGKLTFDDVAKTKQVRLEAALVLEPFTPLYGYKGLQPDLEITVSGLDSWKIRGNAAGDTDQPMGFPSLAEQTPGSKGRYLMSQNLISTNSAISPRGGHTGVWSWLGSRGLRARNHGRLAEDGDFGAPAGGSGAVLNQQFPFVSEPLTVNVNNASATAPRLTLTAGSLEIKVIHRPTGTVLQTYKVSFPTGDLPVPTLRKKLIADPNGGSANVPDNSWTLQAGGNIAGFKGRFDSTGGFTFQEYDHGGTLLADITKSVVPVYQKAGAPQSADFRLLAMKEVIEATDFAKHPLYDNPDTKWRAANSFVQQSDGWYYNFRRRISEYAPAIAALGGSVTNLAKMSADYGQMKHPDTPYPALDAQASGDWDNGIASDVDGPFLNRPDEGVTYNQLDKNNNYIPYFSTYQKEDYDSAVFFSPNRIMPSSGMFGSLPVGVKRDKPWQTLLFRRQPGHPGYAAEAGGFTKDPDYLLMDMFWMPVVEPYAISEPLSTAGKINLNQQIIPFTWLDRSTGMHALLKNEKILAIPVTDAATYKNGATGDYRRPVNIPATLSQLRFRFENTDGTGLYAFRSASEICDLHLVPDNATVATTSKAALDEDMAKYWNAHSLTGDNSRERIYTTLYPRLTTRSNTFTVHFRAQSLKKRRGSDPATWEEGKDIIAGDYRGSTSLERYIDPSNPNLPDYAANPSATPALDTFYRWRVRSNKQFAP